MDRVNYKPLGMSPPNGDVDNEPFSSTNDNDNFETDLNDDYEENDNTKYNYLFSSSTNSTNSHRISNYAGQLTLRQLRLILYIIATLLFLLFIAELSTNDRNKSSEKLISLALTNNITDGNISQTNSVENHTKLIQDNNSIMLNPRGKIYSSPIGDNRPKYANYLSSLLTDRNLSQKEYNKDENSIDDLNYPPTPLDEQHSTIWWLLNLRDDKYITVTNYIRAMKSFNYNSTITITTQATIDFMYHTLELCKRWDGPISVAVFSPGPEMIVSTTLIKFMRQCLPEPLSACIRDKVTWHLVYNKQHGPSASAINYPKFHLDSINYPLFVNQDQCPKLPGPDASDLIKQFEIDLRKSNNIVDKSYRQMFNLPYPINVLRNTARLAASTKYVLASDIELYPSINLVPSFTKFINNNNILEKYDYIKKFDFTLPIFEVKSNVTPPRTKQELVRLWKQQDAIFFHKYVCDACQDYPNRHKWLLSDTFDDDHLQTLSINNNIDGEMKVFEITQRNKSRESWEPIFIGTNDDPLYDDRLTWDGRRDKMAQMYEMCLLDYYHFVVGNAFLVHAPGIKHIQKDDIAKRIKFIWENNAIYDESIKKLKQQYSDSSNIMKC